MAENKVVVLLYVIKYFPDPSPAQVRGRPKYTSAYQNFKGRKSSSMMNLYGKKDKKISSTGYLVAGILVQFIARLCLELLGHDDLEPSFYFTIIFSFHSLFNTSSLILV